jgi:hypothetical protein
MPRPEFFRVICGLRADADKLSLSNGRGLRLTADSGDTVNRIECAGERTRFIP